MMGAVLNLRSVTVPAAPRNEALEALDELRRAALHHLSEWVTWHAERAAARGIPAGAAGRPALARLAVAVEELDCSCLEDDDGAIDAAAEAVHLAISDAKDGAGIDQFRHVARLAKMQADEVSTGYLRSWMRRFDDAELFLRDARAGRGEPAAWLYAAVRMPLRLAEMASA